MTKERAKIAPKPDHSHLRPVDGGKSRAIETPKVTSSSNPNRLLWVAQITAIRDTQDRKAFAEVFAHFAPRVKAFLIKSGATHDAAEECAQDVMATLWHKAHMFDPAKAICRTAKLPNKRACLWAQSNHVYVWRWNACATA